MDSSNQPIFNFKRSRKANFSDSEMVALLEGIEANQDVIFSTSCSGVTQRSKRAVWEAVTAKVNACCVAVRTQLELRDKWKGMKCAVLARRRQSIYTPGDGPLSKEIPFENMIWRILNNNSCSVDGIQGDGSDSSLMDRLPLQSHAPSHADAAGTQSSEEASQLPQPKQEPIPVDSYTDLRESFTGHLTSSDPYPYTSRQSTFYVRDVVSRPSTSPGRNVVSGQSTSLVRDVVSGQSTSLVRDVVSGQSTSHVRDVVPGQSTSPGRNVASRLSKSHVRDVVPGQSTSHVRDMLSGQSTSHVRDVVSGQSTSHVRDVVSGQSTSHVRDVLSGQSTSHVRDVVSGQSTSHVRDVVSGQSTSHVRDVVSGQSTSHVRDVVSGQSTSHVRDVVSGQSTSHVRDIVSGQSTSHVRDVVPGQSTSHVRDVVSGQSTSFGRDVDSRMTSVPSMQSYSHFKVTTPPDGDADAQSDLPFLQASYMNGEHEDTVIPNASQPSPQGGNQGGDSFQNGTSSLSSRKRKRMSPEKFCSRKLWENYRHRRYFDDEDDDGADEEERNLYASYLQSEIEKNVALKAKLNVEKQVLKATYKKTVLEIKLLERKLGSSTTDEDSGLQLECLSE